MNRWTDEPTDRRTDGWTERHMCACVYRNTAPQGHQPWICHTSNRGLMAPSFIQVYGRFDTRFKLSAAAIFCNKKGVGNGCFVKRAAVLPAECCSRYNGCVAYNIVTTAPLCSDATLRICEACPCTEAHVTLDQCPLAAAP